MVSAKARRGVTDYSTGISTTSSFHPNEHTHIEPARYGRGSNAMGLLQTALTDGGKPYPRALTWLMQMARHPVRNLGWFSVRRWSERTIILLVMQTLDNSITVSGKQRRGRYRLTSAQGHGKPNPTWLVEANEAARRVASKIDGVAGGMLGDIANIPMTAHFLGGCVIGDSPNSGVVDGYLRAYGHPGLHIVDGSTVSAPLGVNPSLTITAQAERAMALWPNKGEPDRRPALGAAYRQVAPVWPTTPIVPESAPGALRLPKRSGADAKAELVLLATRSGRGASDGREITSEN